MDSNIELKIGGTHDASAAVGSQDGEGCQILAYLPPRMRAFSWNAPPHLPEPRKRTWVVLLPELRDAM